MKLLTMLKAKALGLTRYFTGKACPRGHVAERIVSTRACSACAAEKKRLWNQNNPEKRNLQKRNWVSNNVEKVKALKSANQKRHRASANARNQRYAEANREKLAAKNAEWAAANRNKVNATAARRRASKLRAIPAWADHAKINAAYDLCAEYRAKGINCHVDHIVPLQGKNVCGLHVHYNFQILDAKANQSKSNRF